ncbi:hypothetical protein BDZ85DRAFT_313051 [Elsinoe ampelina]|uniref:Nephrocystin 3-like N-terminal domain-containing protein n=1 Tax=Elsinoe ampelina TaxID=302913 RepID=A0A6A6FYB5_9PEZI|nr:hypothetical protein BDZ85DRAFT_313051 [Elsinoe ampelina]
MEIRTITSDLRTTLQNTQHESAEQEKQSHYSTILQWLGGIDQTAKRKMLVQKREPGTANWFLQGVEYKSWKQGAGSSLWLHGIPGCGKSVIAAVAAEELLVVSAQDERIATAYFHFDFSDKVNSTLGMLLRSTLTQLTQQAAVFPTCLERLAEAGIKQWKAAQSKSTCRDFIAHPDDQELVDTLSTIVDSNFGSVYLVIDALDEASDLESLLHFITNVLTQQSPKLHLLLTSRKDILIDSALENATTCLVGINPQTTNADISLYVANEVMRQPKLQRWREDLRQEVQTTLSEAADGM